MTTRTSTITGGEYEADSRRGVLLVRARVRVCRVCRVCVYVCVYVCLVCVARVRVFLARRLSCECAARERMREREREETVCTCARARERVETKTARKDLAQALSCVMHVVAESD